MKVCNKCGSVFEGRKCKPCWAKYIREWNAKNPEKVKATNLAWTIANPEKVKLDSKMRASKWALANPEKRCAISAKYRLAHPEKVKQYRLDNKDKEKSRIKKWALENPQAGNIRTHNYRAKKRASGGVLSKGLAERLFVLQRGKCACCNLPLYDDYHMDHIMPIALGGANEDWNIQLLRSICNQEKHAKHPVDFMQSRGFLI
jgi:5-methylcytosine-specific restriction endonuclease McrA